MNDQRESGLFIALDKNFVDHAGYVTMKTYNQMEAIDIIKDTSIEGLWGLVGLRNSSLDSKDISY